MSSIQEKVAPFLQVQIVLYEPILSLTLAFFVHGFYTLLLGVCVALLCRRETENKKLFLMWTISLYGLATIFIAFFTLANVRQMVIFYQALKTNEYVAMWNYLRHDKLKTIQTGFLDVTTNFINIIADSMLIFRCYYIWGRNKYILSGLISLAFFPNALSLATSIIDTFSISDVTILAKEQLLDRNLVIDTAASIMIVIVNSIITLMSAGRLWWLRRTSQNLEYGQNEFTKTRLKRIIAIILESGILYPISMIIKQIVDVTLNPAHNGTPPVNLLPIVYQMAGIAPTLVIVLAKTDKTTVTESVAEVASSLRFADERNGLRRSGAVHTIDLESSVIDIQVGEVQGSGNATPEVRTEK